MKNTLETRLGMFFALTIIAGFMLFELIGGGNIFQRTYTLHGLFTNVQELKPGDPVKMAGVPIGRVARITFAEDSGKVDVTLKLERDKPVKTDSKASIKFTGMMGQNFVSLSLGTAKTSFDEGGVIDTVEQPDLNALMSKLENVATGVENVTKSFSGDSIANVLNPMTDFLKDNNPRFSVIFSNLQAWSTEISKGGSLAFSSGDLKDARALATKLKNPGDRVSTYIRDRLRESARQDLARWQAPAEVPPELQQFVIEDLNAIIAGTSMWDESRFANVTIRQETRGLLERHPAGGELARLNRLLLEDAYPLELSRVRKSTSSIGKLIYEDSLHNSAVTTIQNLGSTADELKLTLKDARGVFDNAKQTLEGAKETLADTRRAVLEAQGALNLAKKVVSDINEGKGSLGKLVTDDGLYRETTLAMSNLREIFQKINKGDGSIGKLVNDESLFKNIKMTLQKVDKATEGLEDTGPLSVLGTAVNSLF